MRVIWQGQTYDAITGEDWLVPEGLAVQKHFGTEIDDFSELEIRLAVVYITVKRTNPRLGWAAFEYLTMKEIDACIEFSDEEKAMIAEAEAAEMGLTTAGPTAPPAEETSASGTEKASSSSPTNGAGRPDKSTRSRSKSSTPS